MLKVSLYVVATSLVVLASQTLAAELIELSDANKNLLNLEVGKALAVVQSAVANEFKFDRLDDACNFVIKCSYLEEAMKDKSDAEFQGLAGKIKVLLNDAQLQTLCHINVEQFDEYSPLKDDEEGSFSGKRLSQLVAVGEKLDQDAAMKQVLGHLYEVTTKSTGRQLLEHAAQDTSLIFGEQYNTLWLTAKYHSGCSISLIKPICKLVRGVSFDDVSAYGNDLVEFRQALVANDQDKITKRAQASGIDVDELKNHCKAIQGSMLPIRQVKNYLKAGYLDESEIEEQSRVDPEFYFYYELRNLCEAQLQ